jgi:hypothetical protein
VSVYAQSADGAYHEFPDGTPQSTMDAAMVSYAQKSKLANAAPAPQPTAAPAPQPSAAPAPVAAGPKPKSDVVGFGSTTAQTLDQALTRLGDIPGLKSLYEHIDFPGKELLGPVASAGREAIRGVADQSRIAQQQYDPSARGQFAGRMGMGIAAGPVGGPAAQGAIQGFAESDAPRGDWLGVAKDTGLGAVYGLAGDKLTGGLLKGLMPEARAAAGGASKPLSAATGKLPSQPGKIVLALEKTKNDAYDTLKNLKAAYTPDAVTRLVDNLHGTLGKLTTTQTRHADAYSTVGAVTQDLEDLMTRGHVTPNDLDELRQVITRDIVESTDKATQRVGLRLRETWDDFMNNAKQGDMAPMPGSTATPQQVQVAQDAARVANSRFRKAEAVDEAMTVAGLKRGMTYAGGNADNATRQEVTSLINPRSARRITNLSPEEEAAALKVNQGGSNPATSFVHDAARLYGRSSPLVGGLNMLQSLKQLGAATAAGAGAGLFGGPVGVISHMVASSASKLISDAWTRNNVTNLMRVIAKGGDDAGALAQRQLESMAAKNPEVRSFMHALAADMREYGAAAAGAGGMAVTGSHAQQPQPQHAR